MTNKKKKEEAVEWSNYVLLLPKKSQHATIITSTRMVDSVDKQQTSYEHVTRLL